MGYESAPGTALVATECAACARPLLDAVSVEAGMGPDCRRKFHHGEAQTAPNWAMVNRFAPEFDASADPHATANAIVHRIASQQTGFDVARLTAALWYLGFETLAARIGARLRAVNVTAEGDTLRVKAPYSEEFNAAVRRVPGARWHAESKSRLVPQASRAALWEAIKSAYPAGTIIMGATVSILL